MPPFSSRKFESASFESVPTGYVAGNQLPDHNIIGTFRRRFLGPIGQLFTQILMIVAEMDMVQLGDGSIDGTKVKVNKLDRLPAYWFIFCSFLKYDKLILSLDYSPQRIGVVTVDSPNSYIKSLVNFLGEHGLTEITD